MNLIGRMAMIVAALTVSAMLASASPPSPAAAAIADGRRPEPSDSPVSLVKAVAGFVLTYMRAFRVGDMVGVDEDRGMVVELTHLATRIRSPKNEIVTIPNATCGALAPGARPAAPGSGTHVEHPERPAAVHPPDRTGAGPGRLELNAYTKMPERMLRTYPELHQNIQDAFNEYGVQIMTPFYEGDKEAPPVVAKEKWYAAPAKVDAKEPVDAASRTS